MTCGHASAHRERDKNVTLVVRSVFITQSKIVINIFKCNLITRKCSEKCRKNVQHHTPEGCIFNLRNILPKIESFRIVISELIDY